VGHIVKANQRAIVGDAAARSPNSPYAAERSQVVEGDDLRHSASVYDAPEVNGEFRDNQQPFVFYFFCGAVAAPGRALTVFCDGEISATGSLSAGITVPAAKMRI